MKEGFPLTHVVLDNGELAKISREQLGAIRPVWQTQLVNPDFAEFATSCGAAGFSVRHGRRAAPALEAALAITDRPEPGQHRHLQPRRLSAEREALTATRRRAPAGGDPRAGPAPPRRARPLRPAGHTRRDRDAGLRRRRRDRGGPHLAATALVHETSARCEWSADGRRDPGRAGRVRRRRPRAPTSPWASDTPDGRSDVGRAALPRRRRRGRAWPTGTPRVAGPRRQVGLDAPTSPAPIQLWPEHFDASCLLVVGPGPDDRCDLGVSPGDHHHEEPYLYVGPWVEPPPRRPGVLERLLRRPRCHVRPMTSVADAVGLLSRRLVVARRLSGSQPSPVVGSMVRATWRVRGQAMA